MNRRLREILNNTSKGIGRILSNTTKSFVSLLRVMVLSRCNVARQTKHYSDFRTAKDCIILANGPSLKNAFERGEVHCEGKDVFVVNMFVNLQEFWSIKPKFYCIIDGAFFTPKEERHVKLITELAEALNKVDWIMFLYISANCVNGGLMKELHNNYIKVVRWNTTTFEGFKSLCFFAYSHNIAMPRCQTVTNMALVTSINMGYENIYLYGADHSWTRDLRVDDDNIVCYGDRHVYANGVQVIKKKCTISHLLNQFAKMFEAHWVINEYANTRGVKIWNCTRNSFIDAYSRKYN